MVSLFEHTRMSDISYRIRFLACEQIELALSGMFPKAQVLPFGSSVNSFGKNSSDLDMVVVLNESRQQVRYFGPYSLSLHS
jgi:DNA polymerase sigma